MYASRLTEATQAQLEARTLDCDRAVSPFICIDTETFSAVHKPCQIREGRWSTCLIGEDVEYGLLVVMGATQQHNVLPVRGELHKCAEAERLQTAQRILLVRITAYFRLTGPVVCQRPVLHNLQQARKKGYHTTVFVPVLLPAFLTKQHSHLATMLELPKCTAASVRTSAFVQSNSLGLHFWAERLGLAGLS